MADRLPREVGASRTCSGAGCGIDGELKDLSRAPRKHSGAGVALVDRLFYLADQLSDINDRCRHLSGRLSDMDGRQILSGDHVAASADRQISCADQVRELDGRCPGYDDHIPESVARRFLSLDHVRGLVDHVFEWVDYFRKYATDVLDATTMSKRRSSQ